MGTKTIRVREEVYEQLRAQKRPDESFSDLLSRLTDRGTQFEAGFGALGDVDFEGGLDELDQLFERDFDQ
ncbi:antitoxin VapB family protein [Halodesulfurarchaeum sp. HSR-GB]|uniref:antitoxin VapB family protein n=1 Tax=Halodesulfurarchaeum sp. HSR-GB TaxID=3074077 RepID=UPI002862E84E|nr:antitoxin VapB family protein [Halodesulfurarchaeum sp. HSR-GB]MDR5657360.1 antitoxin VapB family protein [Halodesulfurarchaeum sp. HSR-GB]